MLCPFTHDKVLKFIKQLKSKGSAGPDAMPEFSNVTGGLIALPLSIILTYPFIQANYQLYGSVLPLPLLSERGQLVILQTTGLFLSPASRASCLNVESKSLFYHIYCTTTSLADISMGFWNVNLHQPNCWNVTYTPFTLYDCWTNCGRNYLCNSCTVRTLRATVGQTVCPTVCRSVHTMQLLHRQLDKLSHVVFTLCDGLSN